jgi:Fels-1 Prophage Protein-like
MRRLLAGLAFAAALTGGDPLPMVWADGPAVRIDPNFVPFRPPPNVGSSTLGLPPAYRSMPGYPSRRPVVNCDAYGRCWQRAPGYYGGYHRERRGARPPGWTDDVPYRARDPYRFERPRSGVVCDYDTNLCYKRGRIDKSETEDVFGDRAGDRADDLRDRRGTGRLFVPERGVSCDPGRKVCFDDGVADYSQTRRYFGRRAADAVD